MSKTKKSPEIKYGIEITKPWSKEMYDHNEKVASEMKDNLMHHWNLIIKRMEQDDRYLMDREWNEDDIKAEWPELIKIQRAVCWSGFGEGYSVQDVCDEFERELDVMQKHQLHEEYSYLSFEGIVRRTKHMMIGFEWAKHDYANVCE
jgi:hypothetical protein